LIKRGRKMRLRDWGIVCGSDSMGYGSYIMCGKCHKS
jgi:hypothetical protein